MPGVHPPRSCAQVRREPAQLVARVAGPQGGRGQVLEVSAQGRRVLDEPAAAQRTELARRVAAGAMQSWPPSPRRYNAAEPD